MKAHPQSFLLTKHYGYLAVVATLPLGIFATISYTLSKARFTWTADVMPADIGVGDTRLVDTGVTDIRIADSGAANIGFATRAVFISCTHKISSLFSSIFQMSSRHTRQEFRRVVDEFPYFSVIISSSYGFIETFIKGALFYKKGYVRFGYTRLVKTALPDTRHIVINVVKHVIPHDRFKLVP